MTTILSTIINLALTMHMGFYFIVYKNIAWNAKPSVFNRKLFSKYFKVL